MTAFDPFTKSETLEHPTKVFETNICVGTTGEYSLDELLAVRQKPRKQIIKDLFKSA